MRVRREPKTASNEEGNPKGANAIPDSHHTPIQGEVQTIYYL